MRASREGYSGLVAYSCGRAGLRGERVEATGAARRKVILPGVLAGSPSSTLALVASKGERERDGGRVVDIPRDAVGGTFEVFGVRSVRDHRRLLFGEGADLSIASAVSDLATNTPADSRTDPGRKRAASSED